MTGSLDSGGAARVAHVVLALDVGGLERMVLRLLGRLDRERFAPRVFALERPGALAGELEELGVPITVLPRRSGVFDPRVTADLARGLVRERIDLVHTHNPGPHLYGALAAAIARGPFGRRPKVIHTKHGRNVPHTKRSVGVNMLASWLTDRVVAVSEDARRVALDVERVAPTKVRTVLNGVDLRSFRARPDATEARARLGATGSGFHVGCVARLSAEKDHAALLEAFARLRRAIPDARLTLVGDGPLRSDSERLARSLGVEDGVRFAGMLGNVAELYPAFDVFALASRTEGISLTLLEAAACELPIVATAVGGNPEVVDDGTTGVLVPPGDPGALGEALIAMARRTDRAALGRRGRDRVASRFSEDGMVEAYEELYEEVLGPPRPPAARAPGAPRRGAARLAAERTGAERPAAGV